MTRMLDEHTQHTLRMLGDNVTLTASAWMDLLDELRVDSTLAGRIRDMLTAAGHTDCRDLPA